MYYVEQDNIILFFDEDLQKLQNTIAFCPQYKDLEIKETDRPIVNFEFADTEEWQKQKAQQEREKQKAEIQNQNISTYFYHTGSVAFRMDVYMRNIH